MERIPIEGRTAFHDLVTGIYDLVLGDDLRPGEFELYDIESDYVEAEIELPYFGINRRKWEEWSPERRLEVLLHEFAHVEEDEDDLDHDPSFYGRLADLAERAETHRSEIEALLGAPLDFESVHRHIVDSVNEYTVELDIEDVSDRRRHLRDRFASSGGTEDGDR